LKDQRAEASSVVIESSDRRYSTNTHRFFNATKLFSHSLLRL